jgi:hypothetical protein
MLRACLDFILSPLGLGAIVLAIAIAAVPAAHLNTGLPPDECIQRTDDTGRTMVMLCYGQRDLTGMVYR